MTDDADGGEPRRRPAPSPRGLPSGSPSELAASGPRHAAPDDRPAQSRIEVGGTASSTAAARGPATHPAPHPHPQPRPDAHGTVNGSAPAAAEANTVQLVKTIDHPSAPEDSGPGASATAPSGSTDTADRTATADGKPADGRAKSGGKRRRWRPGRRLIRFAIVLAILVAAVVCVRVYVVQPYYIPSQSMEPTLYGCPGCNDDHILINKLADTSGTPHEQDIVVFNRPPGLAISDNVVVKRIVGLPGDTVTLKKGLVYLNGLQIAEPYLNPKCGPAPTKPLVAGKSTWQIPRDHVFVMGDNRCDSEDSRAFGPIPTSSIIGQVFAITWPINRIGGVN